MAKINTIFGFTDEVSNPLKRMTRNIDESKKSFSSFAMQITGVNSALQIASVAMSKIQQIGGIFGSLVSEAGEYQMLLSRLTVAFGDLEEAQSYFKDIQEFAKATPFDVKGTVDAFVMLKNAGMEADGLLDTISMIGDLAQGNNLAFNNMALNMMQIKASGKATAQDIKQFATFGVPIGQALKEIGREGDYTFEAVYQAMVHMTSEGGKFYNSMSSGARTLQGRMANLQDSISQFKNAIGKNILPVVQEIQGALAGFFEDLTDYINEINVVTVKMADGTIKEINRMEEFFNNLKNKIDTFISVMIDAGTVATLVGATIATAWAVANWPLVLAVSIIINVIRLYTDLTQSANETSMAVYGMNNQIYQSAKVLGAFIGGIASTISGLMNIIYNVLATIYNAVIYVSEFIMNFFTHPIKAIEGLFLNLASTIIEVLSTVGSVIDYVFNTNLSNTLNNADRKIKEFKAKHIENGGYYTYNDANLKDVKGMLSGAFVGGQVAGDIGHMLDKALSFIPEAPSISNNNSPRYDSNGNLMVSDQSNKKIADNMEELISEMARNKFNLNLNTIAPQVSMTNNINDKRGADYVIDKFISKLEEISGAY